MLEYLTDQVELLELADLAGILLREGGLSISIAESCTGGLLGAYLTSISGSSQYFYGGVVSYSNQAKTDLLGVSPETLKRWGAVSAATAKEMAANIRTRCGTDIGLSITGIAGPGGGSRNKPVGLIFVGLGADDSLLVKKERFNGSRQSIRLAAVKSALFYLIEFLKGR